MKKKTIKPFSCPPSTSINLPGSKSITNRVLVLSALGKGSVIIRSALKSEDTMVMQKALKKFGVKIRNHQKELIVDGCAGKFPLTKNCSINICNSGTSVRFLTALAALRNGKTFIDGSARMRQRPIAILLDGLNQLNIDAKSINNNGCPPIQINGKGSIEGGHLKLAGNISSQFFSALLHIACQAHDTITIEITNEIVSIPFLTMTIKILAQFHVTVEHTNDYRRLIIKPQTIINPKTYTIESDATAASYFWGIAAITGGTIEVGHLPEQSLQGDVAIIDVLKKMGCTVKINKNSISVTGPKNGKLKALGSINLQHIPDAAMTIVVLAACAQGQTIIKGLSTLRDKETDRITALVNELKKLQVDVEEGIDYISIKGKGIKSLKGCEIKTYDDHRMAMCFAVLATRVPNITILDPDCVNKTFPDFWEYLDNVRPQSKQDNLILTGMRCSGKTTIGKIIAKKQKMAFIDLDEEIIKLAGMDIPQIINRFGWDHFRNLEHKICSKVAKLSNTVIATGGGALIYQRNANLLKKTGKIIYIKTPLKEIISRIGQTSDRPSLTGKNPVKEIREIWNRRKDHYKELADLSVLCNSNSPELNSQKVLTKLNV